MATSRLPRISVRCGCCGVPTTTTAGLLARHGVAYCSSRCNEVAQSRKRRGRHVQYVRSPEHERVPLNERTCLACRQPFLSEGKHNRICLRCKGCDAWQTSVDNAVHVPGRRL